MGVFIPFAITKGKFGMLEKLKNYHLQISIRLRQKWCLG